MRCINNLDAAIDSAHHILALVDVPAFGRMCDRCINGTSATIFNLGQAPASLYGLRPDNWIRLEAGHNGCSEKRIFVRRCATIIIPPIGQRVIAMEQPCTSLTAPILSIDSTLWFSAYGFGWGYCAFALRPETVCEKLGAADETPKQLMLAFELGKPRLLQAIELKALSATGERITLSATDF